ncbi:MAG: rhodanese-like domain-containing protein [Candidatus Marinimicrobia bacterium]|nr:rhodanese-like domain-containing protein [Candidatus Neomarinimicrobiota bacterium]MCF7850860.1 rhodanese-like domain-containing protein [Candidatus Neomarinimicrobiota bacterium]MCF7904375.1 rhodanese-like domain-containing protein [Candidatus Neomarinimicrobiota bacterium]
MKLDWRLVLVLVLALGFMVSCESTDDEEDATAFETLSKYMVENDYDATTVVADWITTASAISGNEADFFILDIRSAEKYAEGHIPGAVNCAYADVVTTVEAKNTSDLPVLVACYSGQSAAHAVVALRLSGYTDAKSVKWGMSGWAGQFDSWSGNVGNAGTTSSNWTFPADPAALLSDNEDPVINTDLTDGAAILAERVDAILAGFKGVSASTVLDAPANYQIINYWGATDNSDYGHIAGAHQVTPGTLTIANDGLDILDPAQQIVTYCWTGQTSSMMTAWLTALGYDALSLKFGANSMIYDNLQAHQWAALTSDFPME